MWRYLFVSLVTVSAEQKRCLVLTDSVDFDTSIFKSECSDNVVVTSFDDKKVSLDVFGDYQFSDVVLAISKPKAFAFASKADPNMLPDTAKYRSTQNEFQAAKFNEIKAANDAKQNGSGVSAEDLLAFVDAGRNLVIGIEGGNVKSSKTLDQFLTKFGIQVPTSSAVEDFFNPELIGSSLKAEPWTELVSGKNARVKYTGSPVKMDINNRHVFPVLRASETAFSSGASNQGSAITLAAANQGTNGARVLICGSLTVFNTNPEWAKNVLSWTFQKRAVLRTRDLYHHRVGESQAPRMYREKDELFFGIKIEELRGDGKWVPFAANDVQLEYVMLDPYLRQYLKFNGTEHNIQLTAPDVYGIFKFRIEYNRLGYNPILVEQVAPIRNYRHNDYDRFLFCAYPYYASCFVTLGLVLAFSVVFINHKEPSKQD